MAQAGVRHSTAGADRPVALSPRTGRAILAVVSPVAALLSQRPHLVGNAVVGDQVAEEEAWVSIRSGRRLIANWVVGCGAGWSPELPWANA